MTVAVHVLGTVQDAGLPHPGCACPACAAALADAAPRRHVASIAVVGESGRVLVVDATPDLARQSAILGRALGRRGPALDALALTHAHVGHVLGLALLGREGMAVRDLPVHATASMRAWIEKNRPWSHLSEDGRIRFQPIEPDRPFRFDGVEIEPFASPHRAEDTDTVGFEVRANGCRLVYLPDADAFTVDLVARIRRADDALVDGTFHDPSELPGRVLAAIPHPFVAESVRTLAGGRGRVWFTHLNHSNPLLHPDPARRPALPEGFHVLDEGRVFCLE